MRLHLFLLFLLIPCLSHAQTGPFCIEKSSRNSYASQGDTALSLYKTVSQNGDKKVLLFKIKPPLDLTSIPVVANVDSTGNITWAKALTCPTTEFTLNLVDAIVLHNNQVFVCAIASPVANSTEWRAIMLWLDENGVVLLQKSFSGNELTVPSSLKITETASGNILVLSNHTLTSTNKMSGLLTNIGASGNVEWQRLYNGPSQVYNPFGIASYNDIILLQGTSSKTGYPNSTILNTTKISLASGNIINGKSYVEHSDVGAPGSGSFILTDDHKIRSLAYWRIPFYYQIYFSFTLDTSLALLRSTTFYTPLAGTAYLPSGSMLNKRGMALIKTQGPFNSPDIGYSISDMDDHVLQQKKIDNSPAFDEFITGSMNDVAFDNADSVYLYWDGKKNGKKIIGWIKTGINNSTDFCSVKDSSFIMTNNYPMSLYNWELQSVPGSFFADADFPVSGFSTVIKKELICEQITGFCDPIKINLVDTICSIAQPVKITVAKNPECRGKIIFSFDTAAVRNWQQPDDTTLLLQFDKSWDGMVYATSSFCPLVKDSVILVVNAPLPGINLGKDTILCKGDSLRLYAGSGFASYLWQNGSLAPFYTVTAGGVYYITVKDNCYRSYSDTIKITLIDKKVSLGADISICKKESTGLTASGNFVSYTWAPVYNISNVNLKSVVVHPEIPTTYRVTAITAEGCFLRDTILVSVNNCPQTFFMPTAFTPNNDGKNDLLRPIIIAPLEQYEFSIYNRWGQRIFYTTDRSKGWNGKLDGMEQNTGSFAWMCTYKFYDQPPVFKKGTFILMR